MGLDKIHSRKWVMYRFQTLKSICLENLATERGVELREFCRDIKG